ncbi:dTDP-4-dehydrorhamnose reductase [Neobacillus niacini]|uniref:dTDP-4-dehydrorhamnose reductase n=1 Tax=Neobacillus niacini TaxID=86668 RepID=UPI0028656207|nr:dTDP-4-dehydrorhamnose reductase [Neobacillus niacini]MDR6999835.1 dTDP-4-dehydrorhamnose reductase [Neobacillus niacini]
MDILVTGANGQLGKEMKRELSLSHSVIALSKTELDITEREKVEKLMREIKPNLIIHCAAFTAVDLCEISQKKALEVNGLATSYLTDAADKIGARMFYISSDYVFDGKKKSPYVEEDDPNPQSIYGLSKWLGEQFVLRMEKGTVIRTSWLYGHDGRNFVKTMLQLAKQNREIKVVNDQIGSPTYVNDLVEIILELINKKNGIYHVNNSGSCSWYEFAHAIFKEAGYNPDVVFPISTDDYGAAAPRPSYSVLTSNYLQNENVKVPRHWQAALSEFIRKETT